MKSTASRIWVDDKRAKDRGNKNVIPGKGYWKKRSKPLKKESKRKSSNRKGGWFSDHPGLKKALDKAGGVFSNRKFQVAAGVGLTVGISAGAVVQNLKHDFRKLDKFNRALDSYDDAIWIESPEQARRVAKEQYEDMEPGQVVKRYVRKGGSFDDPNSGEVFAHFGVYIGKNEKGEHMAVDLSADPKGEMINAASINTISMETMSQGGSPNSQWVKAEKPFGNDSIQPISEKELKQKLHRIMGAKVIYTGYEVNCETVANAIAYDIPISEQSKTFSPLTKNLAPLVLSAGQFVGIKSAEHTKNPLTKIGLGAIFDKQVYEVSDLTTQRYSGHMDSEKVRVYQTKNLHKLVLQLVYKGGVIRPTEEYDELVNLIVSDYDPNFRSASRAYLYAEYLKEFGKTQMNTRKSMGVSEAPRLDSSARQYYEEQYGLIPGLQSDSYILGLWRYDNIVGNKVKVVMKNGTIYYRDRPKRSNTKVSATTNKRKRKKKSGGSKKGGSKNLVKNLIGAGLATTALALAASKARRVKKEIDDNRNKLETAGKIATAVGVTAAGIGAYNLATSSQSSVPSTPDLSNHKAPTPPGTKDIPVETPDDRAAQVMAEASNMTSTEGGVKTQTPRRGRSPQNIVNEGLEIGRQQNEAVSDVVAKKYGEMLEQSLEGDFTSKTKSKVLKEVDRLFGETEFYDDPWDEPTRAKKKTGQITPNPWEENTEVLEPRRKTKPSKPEQLALGGAKELKALPAETEDHRIMRELGYDPEENVTSGTGFGIKPGKEKGKRKKKGPSSTPKQEKTEQKKGSTRKERRKERIAQRQFERELQEQDKKLRKIQSRREEILANPNIDEIEKRIQLEEMIAEESPEAANAFKLMMINEALTNPAQLRRPRTKIQPVPVTKDEGVAVDTGVVIDRGGRMKSYQAPEPQFKREQIEFADPDERKFTATRRLEPAKNQPEPVYGDEFETKKRGEVNVKPLTPEEEARQEGELANNLAYFLNHNATAKYRNGGQNYVEYMTKEAGSVKELKQQLEREKAATNKPTEDMQERLIQHYTNIYNRSGFTENRTVARQRAEEAVERLYGNAKKLRKDYNKTIDDKLQAIENGQIRDNPNGGIDDLGMDVRKIDNDEFKYIRDNLNPKKWVDQEALQEKFLTGLRNGTLTRMTRKQATQYIEAATKGTIGDEMAGILADVIASGDVEGRRLYDFLKVIKIQPQEIYDGIQKIGETPMTRRELLKGGIRGVQRGVRNSVENSVYTLAKDPGRVRLLSNYLEREMRIRTIEFMEDVDNGWMVRKNWTERLFRPFSSYYNEEKSVELLDLKRANRAPLSKIIRDFGRGVFGENPLSVEGEFRGKIKNAPRKDSLLNALEKSRQVRRDLMARRIANEFQSIYAYA